ncbi:GNAT family N-acetyltransferase [Alsobacter sp. SYSU M60028]|uniref:GNAT family N-acetyltransferase n=1 Tax=Alsobacter ponti TaxID=2962936 RepID=A0ABT1LFG4_9HYPH|nr:GNAT family N-acetyltransferase [Alsobacter ponti]MCP8939853.1 GNAT family N-acetyltransferase [Alsobacter ponti]
MTLLVRPARAADLPAVRAVLVETWHDTYDTLFGAESVTAITDDWHSPANLAAELDRAGHRFLVAERDGVIVGTGSATDRGDGLVWLDRLYVAPAVQRAGAGAALLDALAGAFPQADRWQLEVEARNEKGLAFYLRHGFADTGERGGSHGPCARSVILERRRAGA